MSRAVQTMFSAIAPTYDLANRLLTGGNDVRWRRQALSQLAAHDLLLDLASGTGDLALEALRLGKARRVVGADFCAPMLQAGSRRRAGQPVHPCAADGLKLPFVDGAFDAAVMGYGWRNMDDPVRAACELARVLRPGGELLIIEFFKPQRPWPKLFYSTFGRVVMPLLGGVLSGHMGAYVYLPQSVQRFISTAQATTVLRAAGFSAMRWTAFMGGVCHAVLAKRD